jgi:hypothetical protein
VGLEPGTCSRRPPSTRNAIVRALWACRLSWCAGCCFMRTGFHTGIRVGPAVGVAENFFSGHRFGAQWSSSAAPPSRRAHAQNALHSKLHGANKSRSCAGVHVLKGFAARKPRSPRSALSLACSLVAIITQSPRKRFSTCCVASVQSKSAGPRNSSRRAIPCLCRPIPRTRLETLRMLQRRLKLWSSACPRGSRPIRCGSMAKPRLCRLPMKRGRKSSLRLGSPSLPAAAPMWPHRAQVSRASGADSSPPCLSSPRPRRAWLSGYVSGGNEALSTTAVP